MCILSSSVLRSNQLLCTGLTHRSLTLFFLLYTLVFTRGKDGHSTVAQNCFRWVFPLLLSLQACGYMLWINNWMFYLPSYISCDQYSRFHCKFIFKMKCDWIAVTDTTGYFVALCAYIGANVKCHLIGQYMMTECSHHLSQPNGIRIRSDVCT